MVDKLKDILIKEKEAIKEMLDLLEQQYNFIIGNDAFGLDGMVAKIEKANKKIAVIEMERRKLTKGKSMKEIIDLLKDKELEKNYDECIMVLEDARVQKESNSILLKQSLTYANAMINMMVPKDKGVTSTYNSYGKVRR
ncbi:MAG: flagellar protein FlgN [Clostridium sp.]